MQYETFAIHGASIPQDLPYGSIDECAREISGCYAIAEKYGGKIVASHILDCDVDGPRQFESGRGSRDFVIRDTCLFLVGEFPDEVDLSTLYDGTDSTRAS
jgi:hypothetical protein